MKFSEIILILILLIFTIGFAVFYQNSSPNQKVCFSDNCFYVEIADDVSERTQGLMFREKMDEKNGMLFVFEQEGVYPFWMKNTILPLDIIWINSENKIVYIKENAEPQNTTPINPMHSALYVLEINAGKSKEIGLKLGDEALFLGI